MSLDIRTLLACAGAITALLAGHLFFYGRTRRVYSGFGAWVVASVLVAVVYLLIGLRGLVPDLASIVVANGLMVPVALLRWDAARRFLGLSRLPRSLWILPLLVVVPVLVFTYGQMHHALRSLLVTLPAATIGLLTAREFLRHRPQRERIHFVITGLSFLVFAMVMLARAGIWMFNPSYTVLSPVLFNTAYFLIVPLMEIAWTLGFIMLNTLRLETELRGARDELQRTVDQLESSLSEVKTLQGMLPICAACKKIRDDQGYWQQIEGYIQERSDAQFSHGICPACAEHLYPEFARGSRIT